MQDQGKNLNHVITGSATITGSSTGAISPPATANELIANTATADKTIFFIISPCYCLIYYSRIITSNFDKCQVFV